MKNKALKKYCLYCDGEYTAQRADSKYCCDSCRKMASRSRCKGGIGYRQNINSLPRNERQIEIIAPNSVTGANQVSTQWAGNSNSSQLSVNNNSTNEVKPSINRQLTVNEPFEKLRLEVEKMKIEAELSKKYEVELMEREKKRLVAELKKLLKLNKDGDTSLSRLRFIADSISGILITQKDIFTNNKESYGFLSSELVPKLKKNIRDRKMTKDRGGAFRISDEIILKINSVIQTFAV